VSTELDLGALRNYAKECARMKFKCSITPGELVALLDLAGEREELREKVRLYEDAARNPGGDQRHRGTSTATQLIHAQHMREKSEAEVKRLRAELSGLLERLRPQDFRGDPRFADAALDYARAALAPAAAKEIK
jgi:hypothetical protein